MLIEILKWLALALVFLLGPVIVLHELGHFIPGKLAGARVIEFGLGLPPRLLTLRQSKGVVKINGVRMVLPPRFKLPKNLEEGQQVIARARYNDKGELCVSMLTPSESEPYRLDTPYGVQVRGRLEVLEPGTIYSLNLLPLGAFVRLLGEEDPTHPRSLAAQPKRWRLVTLLGGSVMNLIAAFLFMTASFMTGIPEHFFVQVQDVVPETAAEAAGLHAGDVIVAVDGEMLRQGPSDLRPRIVASPLEPIELSILREGMPMTIVATPRQAENGQGFLGIAMLDYPDTSSLVRYSLPHASQLALQRFGAFFVSLFRLPRMVSSGQVQPAEIRPAGIPAILQWLGLALKQSVEWQVAYPALQFLAVVSFAIGFTNLLPLPALDGGRALFVLIEAIRGRRVDPALELKIHTVGMIVLLALSLLIVTQDIFNPVIPWSLLSR